MASRRGAACAVRRFIAARMFAGCGIALNFFSQSRSVLLELSEKPRSVGWLGGVGGDEEHGGGEAGHDANDRHVHAR